jgi:uncharacterized phiE125 gp8 family phage protein
MLPYSLAVVTPPAVEPVTLAEAKSQCNVVATDEDSLLLRLIAAAREFIEVLTSRALITQTLRVRLHQWPCEKIELPRPPLQAVTGITYYDLAGALQTLPTTYYDVDADRQPGVVWRDEDASWPSADDRTNGITITYTAGYGASGAAVPARARQAILLLVGHWYRNREAVGRVEGEIALTLDALCKSLRVGSYV